MQFSDKELAENATCAFWDFSGLVLYVNLFKILILYKYVLHLSSHRNILISASQEHNIICQT